MPYFSQCWKKLKKCRKKYTFQKVHSIIVNISRWCWCLHKGNKQLKVFIHWIVQKTIFFRYWFSLSKTWYNVFNDLRPFENSTSPRMEDVLFVQFHYCHYRRILEWDFLLHIEIDTYPIESYSERINYNEHRYKSVSFLFNFFHSLSNVRAALCDIIVGKSTVSLHQPNCSPF